MELSVLNTLGLSRYAGARFRCACGASHAVQTQSICFNTGALALLEPFMAPLCPPLGAVLLVSDTQVRDKTGRAFEKALARLGYRVHPHTFDAPAASLDSVRALKIPEDTRLIVGAGGGVIADVVKYASAASGLPCAFFLTSPAAAGILAPSAMLLADGIEETFKTPPFSGVLCDTDFLTDLPKSLLPAAFGELAAKAVSLFDYKFAGIVAGERFCPVVSEQGYAALDETLSRFANSGIDKTGAAALAESSLRFSSLSQLTGNSRLLSGGESQAAHAVRILYGHEARAQKLRGETEFLCARIVLAVYKNMLLKKHNFFVPPPDNNMRAERIAEFFGLSELRIIKKLRAVPSAETLRLQTYRLNEYRDELYEEACINETRLNRAWKIFKRLYPDDGYGLLNYIEPSDAALCLALAPDLKEKFTLLTYMKNAGLLDEYIKDLG